MQIKPQELPEAHQRELRALSYFQARTIPDLGGPWSIELWTEFLLPLAYQQAGIRHAIVALSAFHEGYVESSGPPQGDTRCDIQRYGLQQYGAAVRSVMGLRYPDQTNAVDVALAACILFATIESLCGHSKPSLVHVYSGLRILQEEEETAMRNNSPGYIPRHLLRIVFQRSISQAFDIGDRDLLSNVMKSTAPLGDFEQGNESLRDGMYQLETFHHRLHHFFYQSALKLAAASNWGEVYASLALEFGRYKAILDGIKAKYKNSIFSTMPRSRINYKSPALLVFNVLVTNLDIIFNIDRTLAEMAFDALMQKFRQIVDWSEMYIRNRPVTESTVSSSSKLNNARTPGIHEHNTIQSCESDETDTNFRNILPKPTPALVPSFSLISGVVPALYMTTTRCRDPILRRRALQLLRTCNRREGLWDSNVAAQIAGRAIEIEESAAFHWMRSKNETTPSIIPIIESARQVPSQARISVTQVNLPSEPPGTVTYSIPDQAQECRAVKHITEEVWW